GRRRGIVAGPHSRSSQPTIPSPTQVGGVARGRGVRSPQQPMRSLARTYWFDILVALAVLEGMLEVFVGRHSAGAPQTTLWFCLPAIGILALPVFARRRFPFVGPAAYWLLAAGISFVDSQLVPYAVSLFIVGLTVSFLLGNRPNPFQAGAGLVVVLGSAEIIV